MSIDAFSFLLIICVYVPMHMSASVRTFDYNLYYGMFMNHVLLAKLLCKCNITIIILQLLFKVAHVVAAFKCLKGILLTYSATVYTKL